jgi:nucleoid-associated protein YgaU
MSTYQVNATAAAMGGVASYGESRRRERAERARQEQVKSAMRRRVLALACALVLFMLVGPLVFGGFGGASAGQALSRTTYVVEAGDTLWAIAAGLDGVPLDIRDRMSWISTNNGLSSDTLTPGQVIFVPCGNS